MLSFNGTLFSPRFIHSTLRLIPSFLRTSSLIETLVFFVCTLFQSTTLASKLFSTVLFYTLFMYRDNSAFRSFGPTSLISSTGRGYLDSENVTFFLYLIAGHLSLTRSSTRCDLFHFSHPGFRLRRFMLFSFYVSLLQLTPLCWFSPSPIAARHFLTHVAASSITTTCFVFGAIFILSDHTRTYVCSPQIAVSPIEMTLSALLARNHKQKKLWCFFPDCLQQSSSRSIGIHCREVQK